MNEAFAISCGKQQASDLDGLTDFDIWPAELAEKSRKEDSSVMQLRKPVMIEEQVFDQGAVTWYEIYKTPVFDKQGVVIGTTGVVRDITERKQAEEALLQQAQLQKMLMDIATTYINLPLDEVDQAIQTALRDLGEFVEADRSYIFDYDFSAGICINTFEWCGDGITPQRGALQAVPLEEMAAWVATHRRGEAVYYPDVSALPSGGVRDILEPQEIKSLLTIPLTHGKDCLGFVGFDSVRRHHAYSEKERSLLSLFAQMLTNIQLRRLNEDALRAATLLANNLAEKATIAAQGKEMFLASMSHEIRTPLNAVLGHAQIMSRECAGCPVKQRSLDAIVKSGDHLLDLINDIMTIIQFDVKDVPLSPSDFDFYHLLNSVRTMSGQLLQGGVPIEMVTAPDLPQFLYADQTKIRSVLLNLTGNAVKFTQRGSVVVSAGLSHSSIEGHVGITVDVKDSGCGIDSADFDLIFNPFEQTDPKQKMRKGVGLGLPLARRCARALGGDVVIVRSTPGQGSTFRFMFKARLSNLSATKKTANAATVFRVVADQQVPRILAVDDNVTSLQMLAYMLKSAGFMVEMADSGACAVNLCQEERRFDLILMDKQMPDLDGIETINCLRKLPNWPGTPIALVTAEELLDAREKLLEVGVVGYISKPVRRESLLAKIGELIDVRYEYDEGGVTQDQPVNNLSGLPQVPVEQKEALRQAILLGNVFEMREIVENIATDYPDVAAGLTHLINGYDYDSLTRWLNPRTGEPE